MRRIAHILLSVVCLSLLTVGVAFSQEKDAEGKNAIAEFEKRHKTKVHAVVTADEIFDYLSKNKVEGGLIVDSGMLSKYREYKKQYGI